MPAAAELARAYQDFDAGEIARRSFKEYSSQARNILELDMRIAGLAAAAQSARFLDYGCGGGHFVKAAADLGFDACGIDLDEAPSRFGKLHGLNIRRGTASDIEASFGAAKFRIILLMHVLEHVPEPLSLLERLAGHLEPRGCVIIGVPDQDSVPSRLKILLRAVGIKRSELGFVQPPIHLHGFSAASFPAMAEKLGLRVVSIRKTGPLDPETFPSSPAYWKNLGIQRAVYAVGQLLSSGGHLKVILMRPALA